MADLMATSTGKKTPEALDRIDRAWVVDYELTLLSSQLCQFTFRVTDTLNEKQVGYQQRDQQHEAEQLPQTEPQSFDSLRFPCFRVHVTCLSRRRRAAPATLKMTLAGRGSRLTIRSIAPNSLGPSTWRKIPICQRVSKLNLRIQAECPLGLCSARSSSTSGHISSELSRPLHSLQ